MDYNVANCEKDDARYICDRLVEYNLGQVPKTQKSEFVFINKKSKE